MKYLLILSALIMQNANAQDLDFPKIPDPEPVSADEKDKIPEMPALPGVKAVPKMPSAPVMEGTLQPSQNKDVKIPDINITIPEEPSLPVVPDQNSLKTEEPAPINSAGSNLIDTSKQSPNDVQISVPDLPADANPMPAVPNLQSNSMIPPSNNNTKVPELPPVQKKLKDKKASKSKKANDKTTFEGLLPKQSSSNPQPVNLEPSNEKPKNTESEEDIEKRFNLNYRNKILPKSMFFDPKNSTNQHLPKPVSAKDYIFASFIAVQNDDVDALRLYATDVADLNFIDDDGNSPLFYSIVYNAANCFDWIISDKNTDINLQNKFGASPLHAAVIAGNHDFVKSLIARGANTEILDQNGKDPLFYTDSLPKYKADKIKDAFKTNKRMKIHKK